MERISILASDNQEILGSSWPVSNPQAIVQIVHGALDYGLRYAPLAEWLNQHDISVYILDTRGHGLNQRPGTDKTVLSPDIGEKLYLDAIALGEKIRTDYPNVPRVLLGYSMGSFIVRTVAGLSRLYNKYILVGTSQQNLAMIELGRRIVALMRRIKGNDAPCPLLYKLSFQSYQNSLKKKGIIEHDWEWLSSDPKQSERNAEDSLVNQPFTIGAYGAMFDTVKQAQKLEVVRQTDKPILILTGLDDPVSEYGKTIKSLVKEYLNHTRSAVIEKYYTGARHEVLTGHNRQEVYQDILDFINQE